MKKLTPLLTDISYLSEDEQRDLVHGLAAEGATTFIDNNQLIVSEDELKKAEAALDRYHEKKTQEIVEGHNATSGIMAFLRNLWPS